MIDAGLGYSPQQYREPHESEIGLGLAAGDWKEELVDSFRSGWVGLDDAAEGHQEERQSNRSPSGRINRGRLGHAIGQVLATPRRMALRLLAAVARARVAVRKALHDRQSTLKHIDKGSKRRRAAARSGGSTSSRPSVSPSESISSAPASSARWSSGASQGRRKCTFAIVGLQAVDDVPVWLLGNRG